jgi:phosphoribosylaminoimidazole carboxylase (NCAIR synthetase)
VNKIIQNRKLEKSFVNELGITTTEWAFIKKQMMSKRIATYYLEF